MPFLVRFPFSALISHRSPSPITRARAYWTHETQQLPSTRLNTQHSLDGVPSGARSRLSQRFMPGRGSRRLDPSRFARTSRTVIKVRALNTRRAQTCRRSRGLGRAHSRGQRPWINDTRWPISLQKRHRMPKRACPDCHRPFAPQPARGRETIKALVTLANRLIRRISRA